MAAIDSLLRVMVLRDAEAMLLTTGQVPSLRRGGQAEPLAMPSMEAAMVTAFVDELVPAEQREALAASGAADIVYRAADGAQYGVLVERTSGGHRLLVRRHVGARPAKAAPVAIAPVVVAAQAVAAQVAAAPVVPGEPAAIPDRVVAWLDEAAARSASDLLLSSGHPARLRVAGDVVGASRDDALVTAADVLGLLDEPGLRTLGAHGSVDLALASPAGRVRVNVFRHLGGVGASLRLIRTRVPTCKDLRLPDDLVSAVAHRSGLVLIAGPAGAGKSTTLVALVEHLNRQRAAHVITLEDPIEYAYTPRRCLIHQREVGVHCASFADGLRAALRECPDVIVVGELRDRDTIAIALTAAETGHLVLGTIHASGAVAAIDRVIDIFPENQQRQARVQLASTLRTVVTQHLLPTRAGERAVALERVNVTPAVASLVRRAELHLLGTHVQAGRDAGMLSLERSLAALVRDNVVELATARAVAQDLDMFEQSLRAR